MRILLVEDNPGDVDLIREILLSSTDSTYEIDDVERLAKAMATLSQRNYDIILLDLGLPDSNGFQALKHLREQFPDIPVVVITGSHDQETGIRAVQSGAQDYLVKQGISLVSGLTRVIRHAVERATAEREIRESENFLRSTLDSLSALIVTIDNQGTILSANRAWNAFFESGIMGPKISLGDNYLLLLKQSRSDSIVKMAEALEKILKNEQAFFESEVFFSIGAHGFWFNITAKQFTGMKFSTAVITHENITQKKRYELNLRASEAKFKSIVNNIGIGVLLVDKRNRIVETNPQVRTWFPELEKPPPIEFQALFPSLEKKDCPVGQLFESGAAGVHTIEKASSSFRVVSSPLFDDGHEMHAAVLLMEDITKRLAREKKMRQIQKMEAIGTLAGGIAHDFNNILTAILGYTELGLTFIEDKDDPLAGYFNETYKAGKRAAELVKQILTFSRKSELELMPLDLSPIVKEALKLLRSTIPTTIRINKNIAGNLGLVLADATQIHQIVMNLCTNASAAMETGSGILTVNLRRPDPGDPSELKDCSNHIILEVKDTGIGMSQETIDSIFMPYFTTKDIDEGTGLGLSVVHGIVTDYNGRILVTSEPGKGSAFRICLPLSGQGRSGQEFRLYGNKREVPRGKETILLVDDERPILHVGQKILERNGYKIITMEDSRAALEAVEEQPEKFDLVITDMTMPKLTGAQLARKIHRIAPALPVILWTGYNKRISQDQIESMGINSLLWKPFSSGKLLLEVRKVLDHRNVPGEGYSQ